MKVILLKELKGKGGEGDIVEVSRGFANNYLFINGIAQEATPGNIKQLEQRKANIAKREVTRLAKAAETKAALDGTLVTIDVQEGEEGVLFGSVTAPMVAAAVAAATGIEVDKRDVELTKPIKKAGVHEVTIGIYRDIKATVQALVGSKAIKAAQKAAEAAAAAEAAEAAAEEAEVAAE